MSAMDNFFELKNYKLDESIRVDSEFETSKEKIKLIEEYHITNEIKSFFLDYFKRILGETESTRRGWNHWLYGYYGSGKSHLLAVLSFILDSEWVNTVGEKQVWEALEKGSKSLNQVYSLWSRILDQFYLKTLPINLLKYQGRKKIGFNEIILKTANCEQGYSEDLATAYFEKWFQMQEEWSQKEELAQEIIEKELGANFLTDINNQGDIWKLIQDYKILSKIVKPKLFKRITGFEEGLNDLVPSSITPKYVLQELENWREKLAKDKEKETKLILLLDEISLFIGTEYDQLTELNVLAEKVDEVSKGNILNVITAQEKIEDFQPEYYTRKANFSILKDRFPHRYALPSRHVGEIVQKRLLGEDVKNKNELEEFFKDKVKIRPDEILLFSEVKKNLSMPLDEINFGKMVDYYPLLPYQPVLFLEILNNLRNTEERKAKSIFSGTARAILALVKALLEEWAKKDNRNYKIVNIIDFYKIIENELKEIMPDEVKVLEEIEKEVEEKKSKLNAFDNEVAKAVFLLKFIQDVIPLTEPENIAVALIDNLQGESRVAIQNKVEDSLNRLQKYIREENNKLKFTDREEQIIYSDKEKYLETNEDDLFTLLKDNLWDEVFENIDLPYRLSYQDSIEKYPVKYKFVLEGNQIKKTYGSSEGLEIKIYIENIFPSLKEQLISSGEQLHWIVKKKDVKQARRQIKEWAALKKACSEKTVPDAIKVELEDLKEIALEEVLDMLQVREFKVQDKTTSDLDEALKSYLEKCYSEAFHPVMLEVNKQKLQELKEIDTSQKFPNWAKKIQVPKKKTAGKRGKIVVSIRACTGRFLKKCNKASLNRVLKELVKRTREYADVKPALVAIIWGLCRVGDFVPIDLEGKPKSADDILDSKNWDDIQLKINAVNRKSHQKIFEKYIPSVTPEDTIDKTLLKTRKFINQIINSEESLVKDIKDEINEYCDSERLKKLLNNFKTEIINKQKISKDHLEQLKNEPDDWEEFLQETKQMNEKVVEIEGQWSRNKKYLYQLDLLLLFDELQILWLDDKTKNNLAILREKIKEVDTLKWWRDDNEWQKITEKIKLPKQKEQVNKAWKQIKEEQKDFFYEIKDSSWLDLPRELPSNVYIGPKFQREILTPIRRIKNAFNEWNDIMKTLNKNIVDVEENDLYKAKGKLRSIDLEVLAEEEIKKAKKTWQRLIQLVGDNPPQAIEGIGIWPQDEEKLKEVTSEFWQESDLQLQKVESGVIINDS